MNWHRFLRLPALDIPFAKDEAHRILPLIIALMVFLAALFLSGGISIGGMLNHKQQHSATLISLQLPQATRKAELQSLREWLQRFPAVTESRIRDEAAIRELVSPWFGDDAALLDSLPLPKIVEIRLQSREAFDFVTFDKQLRQSFPEVRIEDNAVWLGHYIGFIRLLQWSAYGLALLIVAAAALMIVFTSRTALRMHDKAIWLLHSVGAEDGYIARQFQYNAFLLGLKGSVLGVAAAALCYGLIVLLHSAGGGADASAENALMPALSLSIWHWVVWLMLPVLVGLLAAEVARKTALAMQRQIG